MQLRLAVFTSSCQHHGGHWQAAAVSTFRVASTFIKVGLLSKPIAQSRSSDAECIGPAPLALALALCQRKCDGSHADGVVRARVLASNLSWPSEHSRGRMRGGPAHGHNVRRLSPRPGVLLPVMLLLVTSLATFDTAGGVRRRRVSLSPDQAARVFFSEDGELVSSVLVRV